MSFGIDTPVRIVRAGSEHNGRTGVTVTGEGMWNNGTSADRVVRMDDTGERLVFEGWMLEINAPTTDTDPLGPGVTRHVQRQGDKVIVVLFLRNGDTSRAEAARAARSYRFPGQRLAYSGADVLTGGTIHTYRVVSKYAHLQAQLAEDIQNR